mgnify:CR=1 FL=1
MGDTVGFTNREENLRLSRATAELMAFIFSEFARVGKNLILESNFHEVELDRIHEIAEKNGYEVFTLVMRGKIDILHERYMNRIINENRHHVHLSGAFVNIDEFEKYIEQGRGERVRGRKVEVEANTFAYQNDKELLHILDCFMK